MSWLKHAFAVGPAGATTPTDGQRMLVDRICLEVIRRRMTVPAQIALEMARPLNYVSAQLMHVLEPFVTVLADPTEYAQLSSFLEQRGSVEYISQRLTALESGAPKVDTTPEPRDSN